MESLKEVVEEFKRLAKWSDEKGAWVYREDRYGGDLRHRHLMKHKGDTIESNTSGRGYRNIKLNGKRYSLHRLAYMAYHNVILDSKTMIDHINGDVLDNSKGNLRTATHGQNCANSKKRLNCTSQYKGVRLRDGKWRADITADGNKRYLGCFISEAEAAKAYNEAAIAAFGGFAKISTIQ